MKFGIDLIADERERQFITKGWTFEHDDAHNFAELSQAALVYAEAAMIQARGATGEEIRETWSENIPYAACEWPWEDEETGDVLGLKIDDDLVRNLVKAGALIAAEIDRVMRLRARSIGI